MLLIIDHSSLVAERIIDMLNEQKNIGAIAKVTSAEEANIFLKQVIPDIILLDMHLPDVNSVEFLTELKKKYSNIKFIVISNESNSIYREISQMKGASYFIDKVDEFDKIPELIYTLRKKEAELC